MNIKNFYTYSSFRSELFVIGAFLQYTAYTAVLYFGNGYITATMENITNCICFLWSGDIVILCDFTPPYQGSWYTMVRYLKIIKSQSGFIGIKAHEPLTYE